MAETPATIKGDEASISLLPLLLLSALRCPTAGAAEGGCEAEERTGLELSSAGLPKAA